MAISTRSLKRTTPQKDTRPMINLFKIDFPDNPPQRIRLPKDMNELFVIATEVLQLQRPAKQAFDYDNEPITDISQIKPKMNLYISCANIVSDNFDETYKSRLPRVPKDTAKKLPVMKPQKTKPINKDTQQHLTIAASPCTVKENLRNSLLALYSSLSSDHKAALPPKANSALSKLVKDTKQFIVEDSLLSQFIGPSTVIANTPLGQETTSWMLDQIKGLTIDQCQFFITGPPQSGKSTLLSILTSVFYQKLQVSSESDNYLFFPINWLLQQACIEDVQKLYSLIITTTLNMLKAVHLELIPIMNIFSQWLLSLIEMNALLPLPAPILHFTGFPCDIVFQIGKRIHDHWTQKHFKSFLTEVLSFPNLIASAFQFKSVVYVIDHYDAAGYVIQPVGHFDGSEDEPVTLSDLIMDNIINSPYFIASQNDSDFFQIFSLTDNESRHITTEYLIKDEGEKELFVKQSQIVLNMSMCKGCPAYCAKFIRLCEMAEEATKNSAVKSQYSRLKSVIDSSRNEMIQHEFIRLCLLLGAADTDGNFDEEKMNSLLSLPEMTIRVR